MLDENGIIKKSKDARREYGQAKANEQEDLSNLSDMIDEATAEPTPKVDVNTKAGDNSTINGKKGTSNNPTIPKGYMPIDTATSTWGDGSSAPSQDSVDHGLVIKDDKDNEWVWIPVANVKDICDTSNKTEYTLSNTDVTTQLYSKSEIIDGQVRTKPGITSTSDDTTDALREPDMVTCDNNSKYYKDVLGFESEKEMAEVFVTDYKEMIESIEKYGGFYIGRYELSSEGVQKDKEVLSLGWYGSYQKCKMLKNSEKVETRMIWGCQWDAACNFIANKGDKKNIKDSKDWGNFKDSSENAAVMDGTTKKYGSNQNTGYSEYWKANNIYDLAGNYYEWTQEAISSNFRVLRGGDTGFTNPVIGYNIDSPDQGYSNGYFKVRFSSHFNNKVGEGEYKLKCVKSNVNTTAKRIKFNPQNLKKLLQHKSFFDIIVYVRKYAHK